MPRTPCLRVAARRFLPPGGRPARAVPSYATRSASSVARVGERESPLRTDSPARPELGCCLASLPRAEARGSAMAHGPRRSIPARRRTMPSSPIAHGAPALERELKRRAVSLATASGLPASRAASALAVATGAIRGSSPSARRGRCLVEERSRRRITAACSYECEHDQRKRSRERRDEASPSASSAEVAASSIHRDRARGARGGEAVQVGELGPLLRA